MRFDRSKDDSGQAVVLFVLVMSGLFALLALVVNVGSGLQAKHRLQGAADSASLAGAEEMVSRRVDSRREDAFVLRDTAEAVADEYFPGSEVGPGDVDCSGGFCEDYPEGSNSGKPRVEVHLSKEIPTFFGGFLGLTSLDVRASATAGTETPATVYQVAPLALECDTICQDRATIGGFERPWPLTPEAGSQVTFTFPTVTGSPNGLGPIRFFATTTLSELECAPLTNAAPCSDGDVTAPGTYQRLDDPEFKNLVDEAAGPDIRVVAMYSSFDPIAATYEVIGWAAVSWDASEPSGAGWAIDVTFHKLFFDSTRLTSVGAGNGQYDFGVGAVGLKG